MNEIPGEPVADPVPLRWWLAEVERAFVSRGALFGLRAGQRLDPARTTVHRVSRDGRSYSVAWPEFRSWFPDDDEALDFLCPGGSTTVLFRDGKGLTVATFAALRDWRAETVLPHWTIFAAPSRLSREGFLALGT